MVPTSASLKNNKIIMILCDGMRADTAFEEFGYINSLCNNIDCGIKTVSVVDNPSVSRTNYETLHTGVPALVHGITSNLVLQKTQMDRNVFSELSKIGKTSAIVGSTWFYDLYGKDKYLHVKHKEINPDDHEIFTVGRFFSDDVPHEVDPSSEGLAHTLQLSDYLLYKYLPDYLLIHLLGPDKIGHTIGVGKEYSNEVSRIDSALGTTVPRWLEMGYDIVITSDHGMDTNNNHGGKRCEVMLAPLYIISKKGWKPDISDMYHIDIAPLILDRVVGSNDFRTYQKELLNKIGYQRINDCIRLE